MAGVCPEAAPAWRAVRLEILRVGAGDRPNCGTVSPVQEGPGSVMRTWAAPRGIAAPKAPGIPPLTNAPAAPSRVPAFCPRHHVVDHQPAKTPCAATERIPICWAVVPARDRHPRRGVCARARHWRAPGPARARAAARVHPRRARGVPRDDVSDVAMCCGLSREIEPRP